MDNKTRPTRKRKAPAPIYVPDENIQFIDDDTDDDCEDMPGLASDSDSVKIEDSQSSEEYFTDDSQGNRVKLDKDSYHIDGFVVNDEDASDSDYSVSESEGSYYSTDSEETEQTEDKQ